MRLRVNSSRIPARSTWRWLRHKGFIFMSLFMCATNFSTPQNRMAKLWKTWAQKHVTYTQVFEWRWFLQFGQTKKLLGPLPSRLRKRCFSSCRYRGWEGFNGFSNGLGPGSRFLFVFSNIENVTTVGVWPPNWLNKLSWSWLVKEADLSLVGPPLCCPCFGRIPMTWPRRLKMWFEDQSLTCVFSTVGRWVWGAQWLLGGCWMKKIVEVGLIRTTM